MSEFSEALIAQRLIAESRDGIFVIDEGGTIRTANDGLTELSGWGRQELLGHSMDMLLPDVIAPRHQAYLDGYTAGRSPSNVLGKVREMMLRHRSGALIPIELKALDLGTVEGKRYFGAFLTDIRARLDLQEQNRKLVKRLERQALTDILTELPNRRAFEKQARRVLAGLRRIRTPVVIGIADIDHFKQVNDRHGHAEGDAVLRMVARVCEAALREGDLIGRIGGEEFGLLLPNASLTCAGIIVERLRARVAASVVTTRQGARIGVTMSIGLVEILPGEDLGEALIRADKALYAAKHSGRDCVVAR